MIHAHFVISTLEAAADESRALRKVAPCEDVGDGSEETLTVSPSSASSRISRAMYGALIAACLAFWVLAFLAVSFKNQLIFAAAFVLASLLLPLAARHAGRPRFSVWEPAVLCSGFYLLFCLSSKAQSHILMNMALAFHGALVLFAAPDEASRGLPDTRASAATKANRLPRWGSGEGRSSPKLPRRHGRRSDRCSRLVEYCFGTPDKTLRRVLQRKHRVPDDMERRRFKPR